MENPRFKERDERFEVNRLGPAPRFSILVPVIVYSMQEILWEKINFVEGEVADREEIDKNNVLKGENSK
jgi:hypothetical protein